MKKLFLFLILVNTTSIYCQNTIDLTNSICTYDVRYPINGKTLDLTLSEIGDNTGLTTVINRMKNISGMNNKFYTYYGENINNAFATTHRGEDWIIIDVYFLEKMNNYAGTDWAGISIIAHEMGHHYYGHTRVSKGSGGELEADYFAGWMLQKLGASRNSSVKAILTVGTENDTQSHPSKYKRARHIRSGWDSAKNN